MHKGITQAAAKAVANRAHEGAKVRTPIECRLLSKAWKNYQYWLYFGIAVFDFELMGRYRYKRAHAYDTEDLFCAWLVGAPHV